MRLTPEQVRPMFPAASKVAYLNAAAASPMALPVQAAQVAHLQQMVEQGDHEFMSWLEQKEDIRRRLAQFIEAAPEELAFLPSTSMGFHAVAEALVQLGVKQVVTLAQEFPSTTLPLLHRGLELVVVNPRPDGSYSVEDVERALTSSCGAVALSAVQYASGFRFDLQALGALCQEKKLYLAVNAAQALGQIPLSVQRPPVDFLCATSHKWMMGGYGVGLFYARASLYERLKPPFAGWLSVENPMQMNPFLGAEQVGALAQGRVMRGARFRSQPSALEAGCGSFVTVFGLGAALGIIEEVGIEAIEAHNLALQATLRGGLRQRGFLPNAPDASARGSGICVVKVAGEAEKVVVALYREGVAVSARGGGIRIATHVFNDSSDIQRLLSALDSLGVRPG